MNKVTEIVKAWSAKVYPTPEQQQRAEIRYAICNECEFKKVNVLNIEFCGQCGCPLDGKVFTPKTPAEGNCPEGKWPM